ncbi:MULTISPECIES: FtsK/SpoIIIE family DNA translocase [Butyricimonas]|uniref:FtsK/SpoIIIE family DNA translocase n=1 Tax=Butyricimonas TaxID=574697 RepID=UPI001D0632DD|nr:MULTISPECIES: DNA translocase FtsK [Butyricimonas]MCB6971927.1 DNA translocase FtsK [Butyricimonas synergistica]MCG4518935.1 DNA translocase FtsK [Butyricimonas sp. DFI.6.44]
MITRINSKKNEKTRGSLSLGFLRDPRTRVVVGLIFMLFSVYLFVSLAGFFFTGGMDQSLIDKETRELVTNPDIVVGNPGRKLGAYLSDLLVNRWFGVSSFIFCYLLFIIGLGIMGRPLKSLGKKILLSFVLVIWISLLLGYIFNFVPSGYVFPGGAHGYFVCFWLNSFIGEIGTLFLLLVSFAVILFFGFENAFNKCVTMVKAYFARKAQRKEERRMAREAAATQREMKTEQPENETEDTNLSPENEIITEAPTEDEFYSNVTEKEPIEEDHTEEITSLVTVNNQVELPLNDENREDIRQDTETITPPATDDIELTVMADKLEEQLTKNLMPDTEYDPTLDLSNYQYPPLDLLEEYASNASKVTAEELEENKNTIVETLRQYKIEITKIKATIGPTVTLYEIVPAPGIKISKIKNLEDDIALSLAALGIRIIAPIPGAGTIGIEVPNQKPEIVSMRGVIASKKFQESKYALPVALGRTISNEPYTFDLAKMPHLLVAGATGQGKSVGLNAIITSLLYKKHPSQLKFVMVDPKKVELSIYSVIEKHFLAKLPDAEEAIITDNDKVVATLNSLCIEMDSRYDLLKLAHVRNIKEYNEKFVKRQLNPNNGHRYLPYIVVVVDEFADLIMTAGKEVEQPIARIAQLARAVGIHMIIATQRPSTNIITGVIKANFPARVAFKVASMIDSRTILDSPGANQLIGRGDMLISKDSEMVRVQCAFVDTPEVDAVTKFIADQQGYPEAYMLPEYVSDTENGVNSDVDLGMKDPLFEEAARLVVNTQQGSTSSIQRRFSIGYNRAGRIIDQLEAAGIVGPFEGSKARQVLIPDEYSLEHILKTVQEQF